MATVLTLLFGVVLTTGALIFASAEFSFAAVDQVVLDKRVEEGDRGVVSVFRVIRVLSTQLSSAQAGITFTMILLNYTMQNVLADLLGDLLGSVNLVWGLTASIMTFVVAASVNIFSMLFGELVPGNLALAHPLTTVVCVALFQMAFTAIARPVIWVLGGTANWVLTHMDTEPQEEIPSARSASELAVLVEYPIEGSTFDISTADLFVNTIRMPTLSAADVMTDRGRLHTPSEGGSVQDALDLAREAEHSRFPVIGDNSDDILGLVSSRHAVAVPADHRAEVLVTPSSLTTDASSVPETAPIGLLMAQLRDEGLQMVVVVDEYGDVSGIVTPEDIVEEIVDEVSDEHDQRHLGIHPCPDGIFLVPGTLCLDELAHRTDINLSKNSPYDTIGGLVMNELDEVPVVGSRTSVDDIDIEVTQMQGRYIARVATTPAFEAKGEGASL